MAEIQFRMKSVNKFFLVPFRLVDEFILEANEGQLKVLLFLLRNFEEELSLSDLCVFLQRSRTEVEAAVSFWMSKGFLSEKDGYIVFNEEYSLGEGQEKYLTKVKKAPVSYLPEEISRRKEKDREAAQFLRSAEHMLGRLLTFGDISRLLALHDELGLPWEVLSMLVEYCRQMDKKGTRYIQAVAEAWSDLQIDSVEKADNYITAETKKREAEGKIRRLMGISDRALSAAEKRSMETWTRDYGYGMEMIRLAYDKMVDQVGKISFPYMNKILKSWHEMEIKTPEQVERDKKPVSEQDSRGQDDWDKIQQLSQQILTGEREFK